jgi:hypothetical protein
MLTILLAWIYITFLCWGWGVLFLQLIKRSTKTDLDSPSFSIICVTGLAVITIIAGLLSLAIPLGNWWVQLVFIIPSIFPYLKKNVRAFFGSPIKEFSKLHLISVILLAACLFFLLVMSSWTVVHPDTLGYHAQTIQWIEKYKAVPGLVHLHVRFGYQGLWFVDCALFGFIFTGQEGITSLNSTVLLWFFIFMIHRIDFNFFKQGNKIYSLLWTVLLMLNMWSYTQVRLTATSASPDFIATLFILTIIYLLIEKNQNHLSAPYWLLASFLSLVAVTIKLSVAPILLITMASALLSLFGKKIKMFFVVLAMSALAFAPFIARNIITSGYVVFPSTFIDVANVDWKYSNELTVNEKNYITAYAKKPGVATKEEIDATNKMSVSEWLPGWWQKRSAADKAIMILLLSSILTVLIFIKRIIRSGFIPILVLITMITGMIFWFMNAPDPRFGFGSILGFIAVVAYLVFKEEKVSIHAILLMSLMVVLIAAVASYTGYRFINFFNKAQLLTPLGIEKVQHETFDCDGIKINTPIDGKDFGITPVPCTDLGCERFSPRGNEVREGFRAK